MCHSPATRIVTVQNREGLHLRAATMIAELARRHRGEVKITKGRDRVEATDVLQVVSLAARQGENLVLEATGDEAQAVLDELAQLFESLAQNQQPEQKHS